MPRDPRSFITVVDTMPEHEKAEGLSDTAFRLLIETWCWCKRQNNDGTFGARAWARRGTPESRAELVDYGWVDIAGEVVTMHDYAQHQQTSEDRAHLRAVRAAAGSKGGSKKAANARERVAQVAPDKGESSKPVANARTLSQQTLAEVEVEVEVEDPPMLRMGPPEGAEGTDGEVVPMPKKTAAKKGTRLARDWQPPLEVVAQMRAEYPTLDLKAVHAEFLDYWCDLPGARALKLDWTGTWRNSVRRAAGLPHHRRTNGHPAGGVDWDEAARMAAEMDNAR